MASLAGCLSHRGLPIARIGAPFVVVAGRSVRGASLQAATMGLLPADGLSLQGITQSEAVGIHEVCTIIRLSRPRRLSSPIFR